MAGPPPPGPPKLGYKSKREREEEERRAREVEEEERRRQEAEEAERRQRFKAEQRTREEQKRERYLTARKVARGVPRALYGATVPGVPPTPAQPPPVEAVAIEEGEEEKEPWLTPAPGPPAVMELPSGGAVPEAEEEQTATAPPPRRRLPPRPPKSPDMRPVWAGFLLAGVGTAQLLWGLYTMARAPWVGEDRWADAVEWASFAAGFSAALLGLFAVRGGMWSFRKERYDRVLWGAVCATLCFWALWVPWVVGLIALFIVHAARDEYYPHYDPARDAPEWARPPMREPEEGEEEGVTEEGGGGEQTTDGVAPARS